MNVFRGAVAKALKVRERRLGIGAGVVEALGLQQSDRDIEAGLSRAEDVARLFLVANALLVMLQRAVDVADLAEDVAKLVVGNSEFDDRGRRKQLKRLLVMVLRVVKET